MNRQSKLAIFGDSIMKGVQLKKDTGRYCVEDRLELDALAASYGFTLENRSRFGCTIGRGTELVLRQLENGLVADAVLLEYGGNDADFRWDEVAAAPDAEHDPNTPLPQFITRLGELVDAVRCHGILPVLMTLPPISASRYLDWITRNGLDRAAILHWLGDEGAIYRYQERYSNAIKSLAAQKAVPLIDVRDAFLQRRCLLPYLCEDGIHPNSAGQRLIRDALAERLAAFAK